MEEILNKIRNIRTKKGYSQDYMAERLDMNQSGYGKLEKGQTQLSIHRLKEIAKILDISFLELIGDEDFTDAGRTTIDSKNFEEKIQEFKAKIELLQNELSKAEQNTILAKKFIDAQEKQIELLNENIRTKDLMLEIFARMAAPFLKDLTDTSSITPEMALKLVGIVQNTNDFMGKNSESFKEFREMNKKGGASNSDK